MVGPWDVAAGETTVTTLDFEADKFVVVSGPGARPRSSQCSSFWQPRVRNH